MLSNFQFHVISRIDIVNLLSVHSVGRQYNKASNSVTVDECDDELSACVGRIKTECVQCGVRFFTVRLRQIT